MPPITLQVTYRRGRPFAAYIYLTARSGVRSDRTAELTPDLLVDYAADGTPLGIEIVTPEAVSLEQIYRVFDDLGLGRPEPAELAPLRAA
jgi:uncharacterized protein YuzE